MPFPLDRAVIDAVTQETDIFGGSIDIGTRVRSFDFPMFVGGEVLGMDLKGREACYVEGVVEDIRMHEDGYMTYAIKADKRLYMDGTEADADEIAGRMFYPPVNGTPAVFTSRTFGVVAIKEDV